MSEHGSGPVAYWRAEGELSRYITGFHRFTAAAPPGQQIHDALFPSWATIRVALHDSRPWSLRLGNRHYDPVPPIAFVGPTSYAGYLSTGGGTLVGVGLRPLGWAQLFGGDISHLSNRVVPLDQLDPGAGMLREALEQTDEPAQAFAAWLMARLQRRPPADPRIDQLFDMLEDEHALQLDAIAEALNLSTRALAAMTRFNFGFTPKLLIRRKRFLRALSAVLTRPDDGAAVLEETGYWDRSHFLRDSHLFLGCSIREFSRRRGPLNQVAIRVREEVMGSAV